MLSIYYTIACKSCRQISELSTFIIDDNQQFHSREELLRAMNHFEETQCPNCGRQGDFVVLKIWSDDFDDVRNQFLVFLHKDNGEMTGGPQNGEFTGWDLDSAWGAIWERMCDELKAKRLPASNYEFGEVLIVVDLLNREPWTRVPVFEVHGFDFEDLQRCYKAMRKC